jgi:hypothetical protein
MHVVLAPAVLLSSPLFVRASVYRGGDSGGTRRLAQNPHHIDQPTMMTPPAHLLTGFAKDWKDLTKDRKGLTKDWRDLTKDRKVPMKDPKDLRNGFSPLYQSVRMDFLISLILFWQAYPHSAFSFAALMERNYYYFSSAAGHEWVSQRTRFLRR